MDIPIKAGETLPPQSSSEEGKVYEYHLKAPIIRRNELRTKLGLEPLEQGGDEFVVIEESAQEPPEPPPAPKTQEVGGEDLLVVGG